MRVYGLPERLPAHTNTACCMIWANDPSVFSLVAKRACILPRIRHMVDFIRIAFGMSHLGLIKKNVYIGSAWMGACFLEIFACGSAFPIIIKCLSPLIKCLSPLIKCLSPLIKCVLRLIKCLLRLIKSLSPLSTCFSPLSKCFSPLIKCLLRLIKCLSPLIKSLSPLIKCFSPLIKCLSPLIKCLSPLI